MSMFRLTSRRVVQVAGEDARKLLNDTLTCRFDEGLEGAARWFALLSPQGKVQVEGLVTATPEAFWFDLDDGLVAEFLKRMKLYRLRAKVELEPRPELAVFWSPDGELPAGAAVTYQDGRADALGRRAIAPAEAVPNAATEADAWAAARIAAGVLEAGADFAANELFPHDIGMDFLGGVDFKKGCYVGQEVVSRMQHRGTARRRPVLVDGIPEGAAAGAPVLVGAREAGNIGEMHEGRAVAVMRLDRITGEVATIGGLPVELALPEWATYRFGEAPAEA